MPLTEHEQKKLKERPIKMSGARETIKLCPFIQHPHEDCYISAMDSMKIESVLQYCGGDFEKCEIYKKLTEGKI